MLKIVIYIFCLMVSTVGGATKLDPAYLQRIDLPSEMVKLDFSDELTLLVVWRSNCTGCRAAMEEAERAEKSLAAKHLGLRLYGLYSEYWDYFEDRGKVQIASKVPQLHDAGFRINDSLERVASGTWVAVNRGGSIFGTATSASERDALLQKMTSFLSGRRK